MPTRTKTSGKGTQLGSETKNGLLEKELKYYLTRQDYQKLLGAWEKKIRYSVHHTNYYFDDAKLRLRKKRFGLRIRILDGKKAVVTLKHPAKGPVADVPSLKIRHEYEEEIPYKTAKLVIKGKKKLIDVDATPVRVLRSMFPKSYLTKVRPLGSVETVRTIVQAPKKLELELDRFKMFNQKFYELEVETSNPRRADRTVRVLFEKHGIPYLPITKSKLGRFIENWKRKN